MSCAQGMEDLVFYSAYCLYDAGTGTLFRILEQMIDWSLRSQAEKVDDTEFEGKMNSFSLIHQYSLSHFIIFLRVLGIIWNFVFPCVRPLFLTGIFFLRWDQGPCTHYLLLHQLTCCWHSCVFVEWINECMNVCLVESSRSVLGSNIMRKRNWTLSLFYLIPLDTIHRCWILKFDSPCIFFQNKAFPFLRIS